VSGQSYGATSITGNPSAPAPFTLGSGTGYFNFVAMFDAAGTPHWIRSLVNLGETNFKRGIVNISSADFAIDTLALTYNRAAGLVHTGGTFSGTLALDIFKVTAPKSFAAAGPASAGDISDFTFSTVPPAVPQRPRLAGSTAGAIQSPTRTRTSWLSITAVGSTASLQYGTLDSSVFDFPVIDPGQTVTVPWIENAGGLFQLIWDSNAPQGYSQSGLFTVDAEWYTENPADPNAISTMLRVPHVSMPIRCRTRPSRRSKRTSLRRSLGWECC
jgi:hypothetical protein